MKSTSNWPLRFGAALVALAAFASITAVADDGNKDKGEAKAVAAATPQECFTAIAMAMGKNDRDALASQLSAKSIEAASKKGEEMKEEVAKSEEMQKHLGVTADEAKKMSGRDLAIAAIIAEAKEAIAKAKKDGDGKGCCGGDKGESKDPAAGGDKAPSFEIKDVKIDGDHATAKCPIGQPLSFVMESGAWKLDITGMLADDDGCGYGCCGGDEDDDGKGEEKK